MTSEPRGSGSRGWVAQLKPAVYMTAALTLLGAPLGLVWQQISPHLHLIEVQQGSEAAFKAEFAGDIRYLVLAVLVGTALGWFGAIALARLKAMDYLAAVIVALVVGGFVCALMEANVGELYRMKDLAKVVRPDLDPATLSLISFHLRLTEALVVLPVFALVGLVVRLHLDKSRGSRKPATDSLR